MPEEDLSLTTAINAYFRRTPDIGIFSIQDKRRNRWMQKNSTWADPETFSRKLSPCQDIWPPLLAHSEPSILGGSVHCPDLYISVWGSR
jgi:hypothetical protein